MTNFSKEYLQNLLEELEDYREPVVVHDEGYETFGIFRTGTKAAQEIRESIEEDTFSWAEKPVWEKFEGVGIWGKTVILDCGCEVDWAEWDNKTGAFPYPHVYAYCPEHGDSEVK